MMANTGAEDFVLLNVAEVLAKKKKVKNTEVRNEKKPIHRSLQKFINSPA